MNKTSLTALIVCSALAIVMLVGLGTWQLYRLQWKLDLIAERDRAIAAQPVSLEEIITREAAGEPIELAKVTLKGRFDHDHERHVFGRSGAVPGWRVLTPLIMDNGTHVLIDRGFVPADLEIKTTRPDSLKTPDPVTITGYVRLYRDKPNAFTPENRVDQNRWYAFDIASLIASLPAPTASVASGEKAGYMNFIVQAEPVGETSPVRWPEPVPVNPALKNDHLKYALTWFALAVALLVIVVLLVRRMREP